MRPPPAPHAIMDWINITPSDLECVLNKPQLDILKAQSLKTPGREPAAEIIDSIVVRIRAEIAASGLNSIDPDHSRLPPRTQRMRPEARRRGTPNATAANGANRAPMQAC